MHLLTVAGRKRKYFSSSLCCSLMSSAHVAMLTLHSQLWLPKKLHFPTAFFGPFFYMADIRISLCGNACRGVLGLPKPISLTSSHHFPQAPWHAEPHGEAEAARGTRTSKQWLLLCPSSRNLLSGRSNMVLNKKLLLFPIKQKLLPINHLIPELCSSISLSLLLSLHLLLTILATHMSFNAVSLQNGFLIK